MSGVGKQHPGCDYLAEVVCMKCGWVDPELASKDKKQLEAAQTFLAGVWPLLNSLETSPQVTPAAQGLIRDAKKELEPLYLKAMGDELPPDQKPTPR